MPQKGQRSAKRRECDMLVARTPQRRVEQAREDGVTYETRGDRVFVVLHLPEQYEPPFSAPSATHPLRRRGFAMFGTSGPRNLERRPDHH